jgi:CRP-like cAMP-binding protein
MTIYAYLKKVDLFKSLPEKVLRQTADLCKSCHFKNGETIFREGEPARAVWVVRDGWIYLVKRNFQGELVTIFTMTPDEAICGISAFDHKAYSAGAISVADTNLIRIPSHVFSNLLDRFPVFARSVLSACCERMRHMAVSISLAQAPVEKRLTYVLLQLYRFFGRNIPVTHHELANMAGTRWETSIRTLSTLKRRGWISASRGKMVIREPQRLCG